jgi:hypothetical protein
MPTINISRTRIGLLAALVAYGAVLFALIGAVPTGSDNSGYFNEARLLARNEIHAPERVIAGLPAADAPPFLYVPLGFKPSLRGPGMMVPTYPPGLPLMLVPVARIAGWRHAGDILLLLHSLAGVALIFALGRACGLPAPWSLFASLVLAASPLYLFTSLQALSDVPATAWATAAVVAAFRSRERPGWALAAGACAGVAFLVRPNNFLIAAPVLLAMAPSVRRWILVSAGALPGVAAWMAINHAAYGGYLLSGYGAIGQEFHAGLVLGTLKYCAWWLPILFSPVVILAPAVIALLPSRTRVAAVLAAWSAAYIAFYAPYRWTHENWWFLRFLLPAAPALIVSGVLILHLCFERIRRSFTPPWTHALLGLLLLAAVAAEASWIRPLDAWSIGRGEQKYGRVAKWLNANIPPNSVLIVSQYSGAAYYYTNFAFLRGGEIDPAIARRIRAALETGQRPLYAVAFPSERDLIQSMPGKWMIAGTVDDVIIFRCDLSGKSTP